MVFSRIFGVRNKLVTPTTLWGSLGVGCRDRLELRFSVIFLCTTRKSFWSMTELLLLENM
jgi:hypothetical protein